MTMKKLFICVIMLGVAQITIAQRYYTMYVKNPAYNIYLQEDIHELNLSSDLAFVGFEGAPKSTMLRGDFGINAIENVGFNITINQYSLADFDRTSIRLGYAYNIPETDWHFGLGIVPTWSQFHLNKDFVNQTVYDIKPIPGIDISGGFVYSGEKFFIVAGAKQTVLGTKELDGIDHALVTNVLFDIGYKPVSRETFGVLFNIGTDVDGFSLFASTKTMPIHLDVIFDIAKSFQVGLRVNYPEAMVLHISQQAGRFMWFFNQDFSFPMMQSGFSRDYLSTEVGFGIRFSGEDREGKDLRYLDNVLPDATEDE
jgi:hypothetical protein